ncbi:MAG: SAM-dependent chlorinase/fluorinase, partial [Alphaproteobacteria bacterium]|nr:SAM-dependent chlorinase/fluorinase [Alphaproteobacteria bacterium]
MTLSGPIVLFTDFGPSPYVGQMKAVLWRDAPGATIIDLFDDAPAHDPQSAAYLLAAYGPEMPAGSTILAVVDPGVGGARAPIAITADGRWYVGPDNGLMAVMTRQAAAARVYDIAWRPAHLSASFHGRDLFAPMAARLATGGQPPGPARTRESLVGWDWPADLSRVVYIDRFGNAVTGLRAVSLSADAALAVGATRLTRARTFSDLPPGTAFWYENANGLVEIAVNRG